jgi:hypothetical protein
VVIRCATWPRSPSYSVSSVRFCGTPLWYFRFPRRTCTLPSSEMTALARVFGTLLRDPRRLPRCLYNLGLRRSHYPHQLAADVEAFDRRHGVAPTWCRLHVHDSNVVLDGTTDAPPSWLSAFAVCAATVTARIASNLTASVT